MDGYPAVFIRFTEVTFLAGQQKMPVVFPQPHILVEKGFAAVVELVGAVTRDRQGILINPNIPGGIKGSSPFVVNHFMREENPMGILAFDIPAKDNESGIRVVERFLTRDRKTVLCHPNIPSQFLPLPVSVRVCEAHRHAGAQSVNAIFLQRRQGLLLAKQERLSRAGISSLLCCARFCRIREHRFGFSRRRWSGTMTRVFQRPEAMPRRFLDFPIFQVFI